MNLNFTEFSSKVSIDLSYVVSSSRSFLPIQSSTFAQSTVMITDAYYNLHQPSCRIMSFVLIYLFCLNLLTFLLKLMEIASKKF